MDIELTIISLEEDQDVEPRTVVKRGQHELILGRYPENDLVLDKPDVSGQHAKLRLGQQDPEQQPTLYLTDLNSSNGTYLENDRLAAEVEVLVLPNERIRIGNYLIRPQLVQRDAVLDNSDSTDELDPIDALTSMKEELQIAKDLMNIQPESEKELSELGLLTKASELKEFTPEPLLDDPLTNSSAKNGTKPEGEQAAQSTTITAGEGLEINFVAQKLYSIRGKVVHNDKGLSKVTIDGGPLGIATTNRKGEFSFANVPESTSYDLTASKDGFTFSCDSAQGNIEEDLEVTVTAKKLMDVRGSVIRNGKPLEGVEIDAGPLGTAVTDKDGIYVFKDVPEGTEINLSAKKDGFLISTSA